MAGRFLDNIKKYHFEFKHLTVLFVGLILFQLILSYIHKASLRNFVENTQEWYQKNSAERLANLSATTLELMLETTRARQAGAVEDKRRIIQFFDIILNQQMLQQNVEEICLLIENGDRTIAVDEGNQLYSFLFDKKNFTEISGKHIEAIKMYRSIKADLLNTEQIINLLRNKDTYHIFVPFFPNGEFVGALYMKNIPDVSFIQQELVTSYEETSIIYSALFLLGLLAIYYISVYTMRERDEAQVLFMEEHERSIKQKIDHDKESIFTKRIYHTHHKAEKIMGFIKDDLRMLQPGNIEDIKYRVTRYSNFISRVIYDMKWYDPPIQTIRNTAFKTDLNEVLKFIIENLFNRTARKSDLVKFQLDLDENVPVVHINEFVIWEVVEPLIQNSIDHGNEDNLVIKIITHYDAEKNKTNLIIEDNGTGIAKELMEKDKSGVRKVFLENVTTKSDPQSSGYGCYIAYEITKQRCGWNIDVENLPGHGCRFIIEIPH